MTERREAFVFMDDSKNNLPRPKTGGVKWEPAVAIFSQVSGWIAGPIILALIVGKALDTRFGTKPWIFIGLTGFAFIVSIFGIMKILNKYLKDIEKEKKDE